MICTYILKCSDGSYYIGSTNNLDRRWRQHNTHQNRYTKGRLPVELVYTKQLSTLTEARKFEYFLKRQRNKAFYKRLINDPIV